MPWRSKRIHARGTIAARAAVLAVVAISSIYAAAEEYPTRAVTLVVPSAAGGIVDHWTRRIAEGLAKELGQPVVVENRPGASNTLGTAHVARAKPDGYTLLVGSITPFVLLPASGAQLPFDPDRDLVPITTYTRGFMVLVVPASLKVGSVQELIKLAKARPGQLNYGTIGVGSTTHIAGELFERAAGIDMVDVPYKGVAPGAIDLIAGRTQLQFDFVATVLSNVKAGTLKALMVTGPKRSPLLPEEPTAAECGLPQMEFRTWAGYFAPAVTSRQIVQKLYAAISRVVASPEISRGLAETGSEPTTYSPDEFAAFIAADRKHWTERLRAAGIKVVQ